VPLAASVGLPEAVRSRAGVTLSIVCGRPDCCKRLELVWHCGRLPSCVRPLVAAAHTPRARMEVRKPGPVRHGALQALRLTLVLPAPSHTGRLKWRRIDGTAERFRRQPYRELPPCPPPCRSSRPWPGRAALARPPRTQRPGGRPARLLALANALDGRPRERAAALAGMTGQTLGDWVHAPLPRRGRRRLARPAPARPPLRPGRGPPSRARP
jgi:hypothetical protein